MANSVMTTEYAKKNSNYLSCRAVDNFSIPKDLPIDLLDLL